MKNTWFTSGEYNAICDVCGFKYKASELTRRWDGLMVCKEDYEPRHPQDFIRPIPDQQKLEWTRPEATDTFIAVCTIAGRMGVCDVGIADCAVCDLDTGYR